jgi:hypothetical protein
VFINKNKKGKRNRKGKEKNNKKKEKTEKKDPPLPRPAAPPLFSDRRRISR